MASLPGAGAQYVSSVRWDLCGGCRVTGIPTATQITAVLIGLAKIGRLDLLTKLYENIYIPWSVYEEVVVKGGRRPSVEDIDRAKWIKKVKIKDRAAVNLLVSELGG